MRANKWSRWLVLLGVVVGCNAKLSVDPGAGGAGGMPNAGNAGKPDDNAGIIDTPGSPAGGDPDQGTAGVAGVPRPGGEAGFGAHAGKAGYPDAGAGGAPPGPGELGQACIRGETIDTGSGFAAAKITTLDRCFAGLSCNGAGKCAAIPKCPNAMGECVEHDALSTGGTGGSTGGMGGSPGFPAAGASYYAGSGGNADSTGPIYTPDESGVTALAVDDTHLYWLEYGTRDSIGNYQNDGALMAMTLADGTKKKLSSAIPGPNALGVTTQQAYVVTDGATLVGTVAHLQLLRFPLAGGASELIQDGSPPLLSRRATTFAAIGSTAYWTGPNLLYSLPSGSTVPITVTVTFPDKLHADDTHLYFDDGYGHISRTDAGGGGTVEIVGDARPFDLNGDSIYGLEYTNDGTILTKAAKSNGSWLRIRALGERAPARLVLLGDRLFFEWQGDNNSPGITTTTLTSTAPPIRLVDAAEGFVRAWVGTASKVYWTDGARIYSRPIPNP